MKYSGANKLTYTRLSYGCFWLALVLLLAACVEVKNIPESRTYVRNNRVKLTNRGGLNKEQLRETEALLADYVDDSIRPSSSGFFGVYNKVMAPGAWDTSYLSTSVAFMYGYLNSEGFYYARLDSVKTRIDTVNRKSKLLGKAQPVAEVSNTFYLDMGRPLRIDTFYYDFKDSAIQQIARSVKKNSLLVKGERYKKANVAAELDRLSNVLRNRGYLRMSRSALLAEADTTDPLLVSSEILDPFEMVLSAQKRLINPTVSLRVFERPATGPELFRPYKIDSVFLYPNTRLEDDPDSLIGSRFNNIDSNKKGGIYVLQNGNDYKGNVVRRQNFIIPGHLYSDSSYFRTINNLSGLGPWQQLDLRTRQKLTDSTAKADFHLFLVPAKRQSYQFDIQGSQNNNISVSNALAGRFLALSFNATHRNRNAFHRAIQSSTTGRVGFELNNSSNSVSSGLFQTFLGALSHSYTLPKLVWPFHGIDRKQFQAARTSIHFDGLYTDRFDFFRQASAAVRLQWSWRKKVNTHTITLPNFETVYLRGSDSLLNLIKENPALAFSFRPGTIFSTGYTFFRPISYKNPDHSSLFRVNTEVTFPIELELFNREFFQFFKIDAQFQHEIKKPGGSWNFRFFGGVGWEYNRGNNVEFRSLPFFRQYVAGGANSMRAWPLRQLGLGRSLAADTAIYTDRFGDIQLEWNIERRFRLMKLFGFNLNGVAFADIGNVWNHFDNVDGEGAFQIGSLYEDLAVALGTGIRWDFSFLILRLDFGWKVKDPVREGAGWMRQFTWKEGNRLPGSVENPNYAFQFGIGYPF